jgi:hypothetical protein
VHYFFQVTSKDGAVSVFGSGSTAFVPNSAIYSFNESVSTEVPLDVYVRDGSKIILAFRNDNCHSSFKVKISIGDQIHTGYLLTYLFNNLFNQEGAQSLIIILICY